MMKGVCVVKNKHLISIIVPVYNVEKYLARCLDSILAQTFTDFELIAVDDGSPDNCGKILDEYALKDERVKVIHKENGGVSSARNAGLDAAIGEYIGFVDPDDTIFPDMYEHLYNEAVTGNYDIVQCGCVQVNEAGEVIQNFACNEEKEYTNTDEMLCDFFKCIITNNVWSKVFKSKLFKNIRYRQELRIAEDKLFVHDCLVKTNRLKVTKECKYRYLISESSVIHSEINEKIFDDLNVIDELQKLYKNNKHVLRSFHEDKAKVILNIIFKVLMSQKFFEKLPELKKRVLNVKEIILKGKFSKKEKIFTLMLSIVPKTTCRLATMYLNRKVR